MLFLGGYEKMSIDEAVRSIASEYNVDEKIVEKYELLVLWESEPDYEMSSWFLLKDKETGKLFENSGGHCSCYGFEDQFEPSATSVEYLLSANCYFHGAPSGLIKELIEKF